MATSARSVYALRIIDPSGPEEDKALAKTIGFGLLALAIGGWGGPVHANVEVHIIERCTGRIVFELREDGESAHRTATEIADNLDHLDATDFAREWGITPTP